MPFSSWCFLSLISLFFLSNSLSFMHLLSQSTPVWCLFINFAPLLIFSLLLPGWRNKSIHKILSAVQIWCYCASKKLSGTRLITFRNQKSLEADESDSLKLLHSSGNTSGHTTSVTFVDINVSELHVATSYCSCSAAFKYSWKY